MMSCSRMSLMRGSTSPRLGMRDASCPRAARAGRVPDNPAPAADCPAGQLDQLDAARPILDRTVSPALTQQARNVARLAIRAWTWPCDTICRAPARLGAKPRRCTTLSSRRSRMLRSTSPVFSGRARRQLEVAAELAFENAVEAFELLLLAQADAVFARLAAADVHAGRLLRRSMAHFGAVAARSLEEELDAFAAAQFANRVDVASHSRQIRMSRLKCSEDVTAPPRVCNLNRMDSLYLHAAFLGWPATVVRQRRHVFDGLDGQAGGLQRGDGRFAAGARPLDPHLDLLEAELGGPLGGKSRRPAGRRTACSCGCP